MGRNIELTAPLGFLLLHELRTASTGADLARRIGARKGSLLTPGTIYPALKQLKRKRLVTFRAHKRGKIHQLTAAGKQELAELYKDFGVLFRGLRHRIPAARR